VLRYQACVPILWSTFHSILRRTSSGSSIPPALDTAIQLRDLWRSLSQLNDPDGVDRMADECEALIRHFQPVDQHD
jgi:hypothetical protein